MVKAVVNGVVLAESSNTVVVEGNHYFPPEDVRKDEYFSESNTRSENFTVDCLALRTQISPTALSAHGKGKTHLTPQ